MSERPFVSACYIVKDEAEVLQASLDAVRPFADEVVVYDTGSSDDTVAIARASGARVVEGFWDDDFGAARNRALEHCRGVWVLAVDADEVVRGDPRAWRRELQRHPTADVFQVTQVSPSWDGDTVTMDTPAQRVLRRTTCHWVGALHEQVVGVRGQEIERRSSALELLHSGYSVVRRQDKDKGDRNLRIARRELGKAIERGEQFLGRYRLNVGRSAQFAGRAREALEAFEDLELTRLTPSEAAHAAHAAVEVARELGESEAEERWTARLEGLGEDPRVMRWLRAQASGRKQDWSRTLELMAGLGDAVDLRGIPFSVVSTEPYRAAILFNLDRFDDAAELVLRHLRRGSLGLRADVVLRIVAASRFPIGDLVAAVPEPLVVPVLGQLRGLPFPTISEFLDEMWSADRAVEAVLLTAGESWRELTIHDALRWSLRLRERGMAQHCPLRRRFASSEVDLTARIVCGVALVEAGEDVWSNLEVLLAAVPDAEVGAVVAQVAQVSPRIAAALEPA